MDKPLRRHLREHGAQWSDAGPWRHFMATFGPVAREVGLSERDLIRRAQELEARVGEERQGALEQERRLLSWVAQRPGGRWSALDWMALLDELQDPDEQRLAALRDALIARLYPAGPGATRALDLGGGVRHVMVYQPIGRLYRPAGAVFDALNTGTKASANLRGLWFSASSLTVREWAQLTQSPVPAGVAPDREALADAVSAHAALLKAQRRFPMEELRWPALLEYDGVRGQREKASGASTQPARRGRASGRRRPPTTLGGAVAELIGKSAIDMLQGVDDAWLSGMDQRRSDPNHQKRRRMTLVSPVPVLR